jgi:hypothetical protein
MHIFLLLCLLGGDLLSSAQETGRALPTGKPATVYYRVDTGLPKDFSNYYTCWRGDLDSPLLQAHMPFNGKNFHPIDHTPLLPLADSLGPMWRELNTWDSTDVYFYAMGVNAKNAARFEYRILLDGFTVIVPWHAIDRFSGDNERMDVEKHRGFLGGYNTTWDHYIAAELREKRTHKIISTSVIYWQQQHPQLFNVYRPNDLGDFFEMNDFLKTLRTDYDLEPRADYRKKWLQQYKPEELDSIYGLPKHLRLKHDENNLIFYLSERIINGKAVEYTLIKDGKEVIPWKACEWDGGFIWLKNLKPGEYRLGMRFADQRQNPSEYPFTIARVWYQTWWFRLGAAITMALILWLAWIYIRLRRKAVAERHKREHLHLELKSIRSQLNPHFIFNALSSIQGLINKNHIESANRYLSEFGSLMREALKGSRTDFTPLQTEVQTLDTYLKLEQLRFHFTYTIRVDPDLPIQGLEVPSLLLQPLVENAVKHGISTLQGEGVIAVSFVKENANFTCTIRDNGTGFDSGTAAVGYGLTLTRDRIRLLNEVLDGQSIHMEIISAPRVGTTVVLTFEHWI